MPRIKTEILHDGMVVSADFENIDNMLRIFMVRPLVADQIDIAQGAHLDTAPGARPSGRFKMRADRYKMIACGRADGEAA